MSKILKLISWPHAHLMSTHSSKIPTLVWNICIYLSNIHVCVHLHNIMAGERCSSCMCGQTSTDHPHHQSVSSILSIETHPLGRELMLLVSRPTMNGIWVSNNSKQTQQRNQTHILAQTKTLLLAHACLESYWMYSESIIVKVFCCYIMILFQLYDCLAKLEKKTASCSCLTDCLVYL